MSRSALARLILTVFAIVPALLAQPSDLSLQLRSATGSNRFQIGELIPLEAVFSSGVQDRYLKPCGLFREFGGLSMASSWGSAVCRFANKWSFSISPDDGWEDLTKESWHDLPMGGGPMVVVPSSDLSLKPEVFPYLFSNRFRFHKPGTYRVSFKIDVGLDNETTQLKGPFTPADKPDFVTVTAEVMLEIVPASPLWQKMIILDGIDAYSGSTPRNSDPPTAEYLHYQQAMQALCTLGTPEAAQALVHLLSLQHLEVDTCLDHMAEAAVEELDRLVVAPDASISPTQFSELQHLIAKLSATKVGEWPSVDEEHRKLLGSLPQKRDQAQATSLLTALQHPLVGKSTPFESAHASPFPPAVIALFAANYDQFPSDSQQYLLGQAWPLVRSPLMLPLVRRLADAGNGQALLRWMEFEPGPATEFMRKEVLRPAPRFSSFFLRLPEPLTQREEVQLASNFVALTDNKALFDAATLLHRYVSKAVLPAVLPFIDAKSPGWSDSVLFPALAYLLKVSPGDALPRIEGLLRKTNQEPWQRTFFTDIGFLEPSPLLDRLAFAQIDAGTEPLASDAIEYLRVHGSVAVKPLLWRELARWHERLVASRAEQGRYPNAASQEQMTLNRLVAEQGRLVTDLRRAFTSAQAWVFTPEDAARLSIELQEPTGGPDVVSPSPGTYAIYSRPNLWLRPDEGPEYMNSTERLQYSVNQYRCPDMHALKEKILQFPADSTFSFAYDFTSADQAEIVEISDFLQTHGYKVSNSRKWSFLPSDSAQ
jgi:hypothetical protein